MALVPGEVLGAKWDGVQPLRIDGKPFHLGLHLHVLGDDDNRIGRRGSCPERFAVEQPVGSVFVVRAVSVCDEVEDRHDHAVRDRPPAIHREPLVGLHHPVRHIAVIKSFEGVEVDAPSHDLGQREGSGRVGRNVGAKRNHDLPHVVTAAQCFDDGQDRHLGAHLMGPEVRAIDGDAQPEHLGAGQSVRQGHWGRR